jgi:hypothetical protein
LDADYPEDGVPCRNKFAAASFAGFLLAIGIKHLLLELKWGGASGCSMVIDRKHETFFVPAGADAFGNAGGLDRTIWVTSVRMRRKDCVFQPIVITDSRSS